jgi:hypothetical protein
MQTFSNGNRAPVHQMTLFVLIALCNTSASLTFQRTAASFVARQQTHVQGDVLLPAFSVVEMAVAMSATFTAPPIVLPLAGFVVVAGHVARGLNAVMINIVLLLTPFVVVDMEGTVAWVRNAVLTTFVRTLGNNVARMVHVFRPQIAAHDSILL